MISPGSTLSALKNINDPNSSDCLKDKIVAEEVKRSRKSPDTRILGLEPLEERLPVSVSILGLAGAAYLAQGESQNEAAYVAEQPVQGRLSVDFDLFSGTLADPLDTLARESQVGTTELLLQYKDGTCDAWGFFFTDVLRAQGIATQVKKIMLVPHFENISVTSPQGTPINLAGKDLHSNIAYAPNVGSHHGALPKERIFRYHVIVQYGDAYYDPSYGKKYDGISSGAAKLALARGVSSYGIILAGKYQDPLTGKLESIPDYYWQQPEYYGIYVGRNLGSSATATWINWINIDD